MLKRGALVFIILIIVLTIPIASAETIHSISSKKITIPEDRITKDSSQIEEQDNQESQITREDSTVENKYFYSGNQLLLKSSNNGEKEYYVHDPLNSIRYVINGNGEIKEELLYDSFGNKIKGDTKYGYTGKEEDNSELKYYGARYYDSNLGRFISVDPVSSVNSPYVYVNNNPWNYVDISGREEVDNDKPYSFHFGAGVSPQFEGRLGNLGRNYGFSNLRLGLLDRFGVEEDVDLNFITSGRDQVSQSIQPYFGTFSLSLHRPLDNKFVKGIGNRHTSTHYQSAISRFYSTGIENEGLGYGNGGYTDFLYIQLPSGSENFDLSFGELLMSPDGTLNNVLGVESGLPVLNSVWFYGPGFRGMKNFENVRLSFLFGLGGDDTHVGAVGLETKPYHGFSLFGMGVSGTGFDWTAGDYYYTDEGVSRQIDLSIVTRHNAGAGVQYGREF